MVMVTGEYFRESDGQKFRYEVEYTPRFWQAKVRDSSGDLVGSPQIGIHGKELEGEALRESVVEWVECSIRDKVGVR